MPVSQPQLPKYEGHEEDFPIWQMQFSSALFLSKVTNVEETLAMLLMSLSTSVIRTLMTLCHQGPVSRHAGKAQGVPGIGQVTGRCEFPIDLPRAQAIVFAMGYRYDKREPSLQEWRCDNDVDPMSPMRQNGPQGRHLLIQRRNLPQLWKTWTHLVCLPQRFEAATEAVETAAVYSKAEERKPAAKQYNKLSVDFIKIGQTAEQTTPGQIADPKLFQVTITVNGHKMLLEYDTGAAATVLSEKDWRTLGAPPLTSTQLPLKDFSGNRLKLKEKATIEVEYEGQRMQLPIIVGSQRDSVVGRNWICQMKMCNCSLNVIRSADNAQKRGKSTAAIKSSATVSPINALLEKFPSIFKEGLGHCTKIKAHLELKPDVRPKFIKARTLPFAVHDAVDAELDHLVTLQVLTPVSYSEWAAPVVIASKPDGKIRLCADFSTGLNALLDLHQYPLPRPNELYQKLNGGKIFSKIDFSDAYLQMELDEESKKLVVINTHRGLFQYNRLPFGVSSGPAIFQQVMDKMLAGIQGIGAYLDDVIISGSSEAEHDHHLHQVLQRIADYGFHVRQEKCSWRVTSVEYLGFIFDAEGLHTNPKKTAAIMTMPPPKNLSMLRSFLGMVNHYGKFLPSLADRLAPLHKLLKKDASNKHVKFEWSAECQKAFEWIKADLASPLMLTHYKPELPIIVAADASNEGIGAVIAHRLPDGRELPIAYASKTLTDTESRYPQIEKEALALMFGIKKFHQYLWGRHFLLRTDHQPLVKIFGSKKGLPTTAANCLQNYAITLMAYSFDIEYVNTLKFGKADGLSRLPSGEDVEFQPMMKKIDCAIVDIYTETFS
uniref:RNA-directed DNA polymerase n=1 Tax=Plectus sambesii TaxID=2011161 RepID=A0A914WQW0_9BILA